MGQDAKLRDASIKLKQEYNLPKGATLIKKDVAISVEEIENGFIVTKNFDIKYSLGDDTSYDYFTKKWFSPDNPVKIDEFKDSKSLAEAFN